MRSVDHNFFRCSDSFAPAPHFSLLNTRGVPRTWPLATKKSASVVAKVSFSRPPLIEAHEGGAIGAPPGTVLRQQQRGEPT